MIPINSEGLASEHSAQPATSLTDFIAGLHAAGRHVIQGSAGTWWHQYEAYSAVRVPSFYCGCPTSRELLGLWWRFAPMVSFLTEGRESDASGSWLYLCRDRHYGLEFLDHGARGNVRKALRELTFGFLTFDEVMQKGLAAFVDNRQRFGLNDGTRVAFEAEYGWMREVPGVRFLGAWFGGELAAFVSLNVVDDWVEVTTRCSMQSHLHLRPNDALLYLVLRHFLVDRGCRVVSAGVSSLEQTPSSAGLHRFKMKLGFQAIPVRREFRMHPMLRGMACRFGVGILKLLRRPRRRSRRLSLAHLALSRAADA
jgi:hypothetical protein